MKPELIEILRIYRRPGSVLVDYRIIRNTVRLLKKTGASA
ncbi:YlcG family protein [Salmonella enterica]|nr:YlcG family protein [Salmonella enterica]